MIVKDVMATDVLSFREDDPVEEVVDALVGNHLHAAPVINDDGRLVGIVGQWDIYFGMMTRRRDGTAERRTPLTVGEIMTAPAVSAGEDTDLADLCRMMYKLRLHRVPVVDDGKLTGIVSSLDICRAVADGELG